ncbi:MurR/RpiR family transcriptional regulator [Companilactobacillus pabuli]|jgi:DNA-binding MurR/RpiR family transcriptional regulator|uniref:MurR/RpiR family transcriptional regulator n=1 Tax=Companilactobacillus pabuli TaxID=2714036 RepID=A0A7L7KVT8_9LACO|nr:MurR/RpiR family transcriptional regulator [Companilactobacillus pabuli]MDG5113276.1 MurR/RpiR family transcriptional regulator [Companilactobacillus pabuli]QMT83920.1 MurR/RpiR family transcriptional regulator [Companilactobacillus pabuli]
MKNKLSSSEKYLWEYIQNNLDDIPNLSIVKLSEDANVSTATIVRTTKKMGYSGYTDFRQQLTIKRKDTQQYKNLEKVDHDIKQAILKNKYEVDNTLKMLNVGSIEDAIQKIKKSSDIYIFARGFSEFIAQELLVKLQLLGKNCVLSTDPNIIVTMSKRIKREDLVIFITLNGETKELVAGAKNAFDNGVSTLTITTNEDGSIIKYSEMVLLGFKSQTSYFPDYEVRSRLPLQVISRILLDSYVIRTQKSQ